ncbi:hypothetical protein [Nitrospirillum pindoramense]|uniref:YHS domain-containing protein n=1 Tax=Nitrospirillum amazonense TaxID=28077 RepID=A0A560H8F0_9PROT|nr:hypothetical protein [Nitrospirillum amazonense]TWB42617.1 hypothetical protein FBZ90_106217 [Nitrospirillum amazonense]
MRLVAAIIAAALLASPVALAAEGKHYSDPAAAAKVCKSPVVWVNPASAIYHLQGSRYYGTTKDGFYMCEKAAQAAGNRAAESH